MNIRCIIVDDEPLAIDLIKSHLKKLDGFEILGECTNAMKAMQLLQEKDVDLMFMDIEMPQITGIEFLKTLKNPPKVIICSAYREYALDGFELDVVDYILKPITFERFLKAINKFYSNSKDSKLQVVSSNNHNGESSEEDFIYIKEGKKVHKVLLDDIIYIEGLSEYVKIHIQGNTRLVIKNSLTSLEEKLPSERFLRIHKSYIINYKKVTAFAANMIEIDKFEVPIGRSYKNLVMNTLNFNGKINYL